MEQLGSQLMDFYEISYLSIFRKSVGKFKFYYNLPRIRGTLHEDRLMYLIISLSVILEISNVFDKSCREHQITHFKVNKCLYFKNLTIIYEVMCKNIVELDR